MFIKKSISSGIALASGILLGSNLAQAAVLEEVVVTANKREQSIQDVSISVTAFSGNQLESLGITETTEITQQIPGLQLNAWSPNVTIFNLRGISQNNFQDYLEGPVAVYLDDAYMGSINGLSGQLFDIKRLEVLRGPQGTLFGRNATGGLIHYVSQGADTEEFNGYVKGGYSSFDRTSLEMAVGGSLSDNVRGRFAARWEEADGYVEAVVPSGIDIGGADGYALRANLQVDFTENFYGDFWVKYSEDKNVPTGTYVFENCPSANPPNCDVDEHGRSLVLPGNAAGDVHKHLSESPDTRLDRDTTIVQGKFTYDMDDVELISITNYTSLEKDYFEDGDGLPVLIVNLNNVADYSQWSQEFRLSGGSDAMRWQAGAYYLDIEIEGSMRNIGVPAIGNIAGPGRLLAAGGNEDIFANDPFPGNDFQGANSLQEYLLESTNWSVFGQVEFDISDSLMLTTGLRWSQDDKAVDWELFYSDNFNTTNVLIDSSTGFDAAVPDTSKVDYGDWAARIALDWRVTDETLLFASVNRGIKGGNYTLSIGANIDVNNFQHDEEVLYSYEAGFKTDLLDSTLRLNGTVFYYDYEDYQAFSLAGGAPLVANTDANSYGGELELVWTPSVNWDFNFGLSFLESEVDMVSGAGNEAEPILDAELPNAPKVSFNYLGRYNWNIGAANLAFQVDGVWNDDQFLEVTNGPGTVQASYAVTNARLIYTGSDDRFTVSAFAKNITDEEYKAYSLDLGQLGVTTFYAPPTTYGLSAKFNW